MLYPFLNSVMSVSKSGGPEPRRTPYHLGREESTKMVGLQGLQHVNLLQDGAPSR